jgi:hypothetical protein
LFWSLHLLGSEVGLPLKNNDMSVISFFASKLFILICDFPFAGWMFTIVFTYSGFAALVVGVLWGAHIHVKLGAAWTDIRRAASRQRLSRPPSTATMPV